jgi:hypothetical protein
LRDGWGGAAIPPLRAAKRRGTPVGMTRPGCDKGERLTQSSGRAKDRWEKEPKSTDRSDCATETHRSGKKEKVEERCVAARPNAPKSGAEERIGSLRSG